MIGTDLRYEAARLDWMIDGWTWLVQIGHSSCEAAGMMLYSLARLIH